MIPGGDEATGVPGLGGGRGLFMLLLAVTAFAMLPRAARGQTADEVVARHVEALGGREALAKARGRVDRWTLRLENPYATGEGTVVIRTRRPDLYRTDIEGTFGGQRYTARYGYDGETAWRSIQGGRPVRLDGEELVQMRNRAIRANGGLVGARRAGASVRLHGKEAVEGREAHVLEVTPEVGRSITYYIDAETFLTVKTETSEVVGPDEVDVETYPDDYREVQGVRVPHEIEILRSTVGTEQVQFFVLELEETDLDAEIDEAVFRPLPDAAAPPRPARGKRGWY